MQIFFKQNLVLLAVPKTGTTAWEMALRRYADINISGRRKHTGVSFYMHNYVPFLQKAYRLTPERLAVIRDPLEHAKSWYRYRTREQLRSSKNSTHGIDFDTFLEATLADKPPPFANVGHQYGFLSLADGSVPVHHLFTYETMPVLQGFLENRFECPLTLKTYNRSPDMPLTADPEIEARFRAKRAPDFALHAQVLAAGGHLHQLVET